MPGCAGSRLTGLAGDGDGDRDLKPSRLGSENDRHATRGCGVARAC